MWSSSNSQNCTSAWSPFEINYDHQISQGYSPLFWGQRLKLHAHLAQHCLRGVILCASLLVSAKAWPLSPSIILQAIPSSLGLSLHL